MANIDKGFNVEILSLQDRTLITSGIGDPRVAGYEAPEGSLFAYKNATNSALLLKTGAGDFDWTALSAATAYAMLGNNTDITSLTGITGDIKTVDSILFDVNASVTSEPGKLSWNAAEGTLDLGLTDTGVILQLGQEQFRRVKNNTSTTLQNGKAVVITGSINGDILVDYAIGSSKYTSAVAGVLTEDIPANSYGYMTTFGLVRNIDTSMVSQGSAVYISPTIPGGVIDTIPPSPFHKFKVGFCVVSDPTNGVLYVDRTMDAELEEITDVRITNPRNDKEMLVWNNDDGVWHNQPVAQIATNLGVDAKADASHTHPLSDIEQSGASTGQYAMFNGSQWVPSDVTATVDPTDVLSTVAAVTKDMSGFPNRTDTSLSFDKTTRTVTLTPNNANAGVYHLGTWYPISSPLSVVWSNTNGGRYILFDPTTQQLVEGDETPNIRSGQALVAYVYWNTTDQYLVIGGDERHSSCRDTLWHYSHHRDVGSIWRSGGAITYTTNDSFNVSVGLASPIVFADEDLEHTITHNPSPSFPTTTYQQVLEPVAQIPVIYLDGTKYREVPPTGSLPWLHGATRAYYNAITAGNGTLVESPSGKYLNYWIIATNDGEYPVKLIMGRSLFDNESDAASEVVTSYGLPFSEMAIMYRLTLFVADSNTGNAAKVSIASVVNAYHSSTGGTTAISANVHDGLAGRALPDQHPISAITNLQTELDARSLTTHTHTLDWLSDVTISTPAAGNILRFTGTEWSNSSADSFIALNDLSDVVTTAPSAGQVLTFNGSNWVNLGATSGPGGAAKRIWSGNIASATGTSQITPGTAAPDITNGTQIWSQTMTPFSTDVSYVLQTSVTAAGASNNQYLTIAAFRTVGGVSTYIGGTVQIVQSSNNSATLSFSITDQPNTSQPVTYSVRIGSNFGTWYLNRRMHEVTYGGTRTGWVIWEY